MLTAELLGRAAEVRTVDDLLAGIREGRSGALVLVGEPGIGKTTVLQYAARAAGNLRVLGIVGAESERQLGYAALHRLLLPHLDSLARLPAPQRVALSTAFGLVSGPAPDRFLVGLGALTLLADVAVDPPLLCMVDDAHWLDRESLEALAFVARRLHADRIGLLLALRADEAAAAPALRGLPTQRLGGLSSDDVRALLARVTSDRLDARVADRVAEETGGNPLAVLALAEQLSEEQLAGRVELPDPLPADAHVERWFLTQVEALPPETRLFLLVAVLAPPDDPATLWLAAEQLGLTPVDADPAVSEGLVRIGRQISFRHPLMRSAIHAGASLADRRRANAALAAATPGDTAPERRAWHLAAATPGPDDDVADQLEEVAGRIRSRGGYATWAAYLARSAELTAEPVRRAGRYLASARAHLYAGNPEQAQAMLDRSAPGLTSAAVRARAVQARAAVSAYHYRIAQVPAMLLGALAEAGPVDEQLTRDLLWDAFRSAAVARQALTGTTLDDVAATALAALDHLPPGPADSDRLLRAFALRTAAGYPAAVPALREAVAALVDGAPVRADAGGRILYAVLAADELWDDAARRTILDRVTTFDRESGDLNELCLALRCAISGELRAGRFAAALACSAEAADLTVSMGMSATGDVDLIELWAWQGDAGKVRAAADTLGSAWVARTGMGVLATVGQQALCLLELGLGRYAEALEPVRRVVDDDAPGYANRSLADLVEAAVRAGDEAAAAAGLAPLSERAAASGTAWALGLRARARALVAGDEDAEALFEESLAALGRTAVLTDLARTRLLYGEWLRRRNRRTDAREQLRQAYEAFAGMGAAGFAERARRELLATGASIRRPAAPASHGLTSQEGQVASLAADGATNAEIAARLFVTVSTVEYHMNKILRKLDVTSRRQLTAALTGPPAGDRRPELR